MRTVCAITALLAASTLANAVPVEYSFELTIDEIRTGSRADPYYSNFFLGQKFFGTFAYDYTEALAGVRGYGNTTSLEVRIDETLVRTRHNFADYEPGVPSGTYINLTNGLAGEADSFFMFEEVPLVDGGYLGNYQAEQFYIDLLDYDGSAISSTVPGPIDFTQFDSGRWNFWSWGNESLYSSLLLYGTVGNVREVPEPSTFWLAALGLGFTFAFRNRRQRTDIARTANAS